MIRVAINRGNQVQSGAINRGNQVQSGAIGCNHAPLRLDGPLLQLLLLLLLCARRLRLADESLVL